MDKDEVESFHTIRLLLEDYITRYDNAARGETIRPLSIAVFGPPGSGKSFGVKQIASSIGHFSLTSLNLSQYNEPVELFEGLNEALHSEEGEIPLIFMDEFDCELQGVSRGWLKYYLAPMQDGEYTLNGRSYQIKGAVFVFAGGTASTFNEFLPAAPEEEEVFRKVKGPDFVSRLEGILNIKGPNPVSVSDQSHLIRRAMLMRSQIIHKVSSIYDPESCLVNISRNMLSALLSVSEYRHGSRSLEFILDMSRLTEVSRFTPSCLPVDEQLDIHLDVTDFRKRLSYEQMMGDYEEKYAIAAHENYCARRLVEAEKLQLDQTRIQELKAEREMASWEELDESVRREYFSQIHYIGVQLQDYQSALGLRPVLPGSSDTITELYGPVLEELSEMEHRRWMLDREKEGWRYGQYNQLIARRVRECNVYAEIFPYTTELSVIREMNPKGIIFTGGPNSVYDSASPHFAREICDLKIPILGICYGAQLLSWMEGGTVETAPVSEYGHTRLQVDESADPLFKGVTPGAVVWMSHTDYISKVPEGFRITAHTKDCPVAAMSCPKRRLYAVQFHPEVMHTREGQTMLRNFALGVCGCSGEWKMGSFVEQSIHRLDAATAALRLPRRGNRTARSNIISCEVGTIIWKKAIDNRFFERYHSETERQRRLEEFLRDAFSFIYSE